MSTFDVTSIGEGGLRLSVPVGTRLESAAALDVQVVGTEANVVCNLRRLGWRTAWASALPDTPLGRRVATGLRSHGVDLSAVRWESEGRVGTYFVEYGSAPRATQVHFDRKDTVFSNLRSGDVDWDHVLDTRLLHLSGLTAALSDATAELVSEALSRAKSRGVAVSFDVNHRSTLWSPSEAEVALRPLVKDVELLFCSRRDAERVFGCDGPLEQVVKQVAEISPAATVVVSDAEADLGCWDGTAYRTAAPHPVQVIDRLGAGDALASGVIHGWLDGDIQAGLRAGVGMSALALSQWGEQVITTATELGDLGRDNPGRVQR